MQDSQLAKGLREVMERFGLTQFEVASKARVSQSSVCRALQGKVRVAGYVRARLFSYIHAELEAHMTHLEGEDRVLKAFTEIWDGTEEHAAAIAEIITATRELRPAIEGKPEGD
jgi:transcriptional regulator with XRE-family HTH domain